MTGISTVEATFLAALGLIIAVSAAPKLALSLSPEKPSSLEIADELRHAIKRARAQWQANGHLEVTQIAGFSDGQLWSGQSGWPIAHDAATPSALNAQQCAKLWNGLLFEQGAPRASPHSNTDWKAQQGKNEHICIYRSNQHQSHSLISYNTLTGAVLLR